MTSFDKISTPPENLADVLQQVAEVHCAWGLWHLDDDPADVPAYVLHGIADTLAARRDEWWAIARREGVDLHGYALNLVNGCPAYGRRTYVFGLCVDGVVDRGDIYTDPDVAVALACDCARKRDEDGDDYPVSVLIMRRP